METRNLIFVSYREIRQPSSAIIVQSTSSSIIQQFREAPSAYIFFVNELIQHFIDVRCASIALNRIFSKIKDHLWGDLDSKGAIPYVYNDQSKMDVNIVNEHMALFFHDIMKDQAIYKIMKSAQQSLEEDKATLQEYRIFKQIILVYKKIYSYCKQCYKVALIKRKFENPQGVGKPRRPGNYCANRETCTNKNCTARMQQCTQNLPHLEEEKADAGGSPNESGDLRAQPITRSNAMDEEILEEDESEDSDDMTDDEVEDPNEDFSENTINHILDEFRAMMHERMEQERNTEKIKKQMNNLSVEEVVNMIESNPEKCQESQGKKRKRKNKKKKKTENQNKFEEEMEAKSPKKFKAGNNENSGQSFNGDDSEDNSQKERWESNKPLKDKLENDFIDEEQIIEEFKKSLEQFEPYQKSQRLIPNFSVEWIHSLKKKLSV